MRQSYSVRAVVMSVRWVLVWDIVVLRLVDRVHLMRFWSWRWKACHAVPSLDMVFSGIGGLTLTILAVLSSVMLTSETFLMVGVMVISGVTLQTTSG